MELNILDNGKMISNINLLFINEILLEDMKRHDYMDINMKKEREFSLEVRYMKENEIMVKKMNIKHIIVNDKSVYEG